MRFLIVGAGAVGGYFGGRLAETGRDVTFLVRSSRAKQLRQDGLRIISPHGDAVLTPKLITAEEIDTPYDLVFLSVKAYALEAAMNDFAAAVGPETMIFPVLNGMRHVDLLSADQFRSEDRVTMPADDAKTIPTELFRPGWTDEEGHVAPGLGKPAAKVAADGTCANDKDPHSRRGEALG